MTRRTRIAVRSAAPAAALIACLTAAPALAADHTAAPSPLGTLDYRTVTWTSQGAAMSVTAPRTWSFVLTPDGQARFNAPDRPDVLTMGYRGAGPLRPQLSAQVATLRGTPGLQILEAHGRGRGDTAVGELRYRWTPPGRPTRIVDYRFRGDDAYEVAGPLSDREGLEAVLQIASNTGDCS